MPALGIRSLYRVCKLIWVSHAFETQSECAAIEALALLIPIAPGQSLTSLRHTKSLACLEENRVGLVVSPSNRCLGRPCLRHGVYGRTTHPRLP
jgi:hypothetical protein